MSLLATDTAPSPDPSSGEDRPDKPDPSEARRKNVRDWTSKIQRAKTDTWKDVFKAMREGMKFLSGLQWGDKKTSDEKYVANIVQRHVQQRVAALYAKNPKFVARRRKTRDFTVWDGTPEALEMLKKELTLTDPVTGAPLGPNPNPTPTAVALLKDITDGLQKRQTYDNIAETMEIVMAYFTNEDQTPPFKRQMKQLVRRVCACKVGFIKIGYQRQMEPKPENVDKIGDITEKLALLVRLAKEISEGEKSESDAEADRLLSLKADLEADPGHIVSEGLTFDFPGSASIIVDPRCKHLTSFLGARWIAHEFVLEITDIEEIYGVDVSDKAFTAYKRPDEAMPDSRFPDSQKARKCCVWEVWDKHARQVFVIAEGYPDFLKEPAAPDIKIKRFWPFFPLSFNEVENDECIYPQSDVELLMPMQREINRAREGLREHRIANKPRTIGPKGSMDDEDRARLRNQQPFEHIEIGAIPPGGKISDLVQPFPVVVIDAQLYDTSMFKDDAFAVGGQSEASIGNAQSGVTATGDSIAESNRASFNGSVTDEMDDMLSEMAKAAGEILLLEMSAEKAKEIAGVGAVWPELTAQQIADDLIMSIEAGSSGRPNKAAEIDNLNKLAPVIMGIPGVSPVWFAKQAVKRLDDNVDMSDAIASGIPSMLSMQQSQMTAPLGGPASDPSLQGPKGAQNAPGGAPQALVNPGAHNMAPGATVAAQ
jgi:hypothetical protein